MKPKVIKGDTEHQSALTRVAALMAKPRLSPGQEDELELWGLLIERYEDEHVPIARPTPLGAIRFRMEQLGLRPADLVSCLGSRSRVSEVLAGKRRLSLAMIRRLHERLGIPAEVLLPPVAPDLSAAEPPAPYRVRRN